MSKIDFKKTLNQLYNPPKHFVVVDVPRMQFLMVDGHGDPNLAQAYQDALESVYTVAYKMKFISKSVLGKDYVVPPLEGLWWAEDMDSFTVVRDKSCWDWTMMIMTPDWMTQEMFDEAVDHVRTAKKLPAINQVRLENYYEGLSVQILHLGSYDSEAPTLAELHHQFIPSHGYLMAGKHHEIYLSDPRRVPPEKLKTILRQPVASTNE